MEPWVLYLFLIGKKGAFKEHELIVHLWIDEDGIPVLSGLINKNDVISDQTMFRFINNTWIEFPKGDMRAINIDGLDLKNILKKR